MNLGDVLIMSEFKIQIPQHIVRNDQLNDKDFIVLAKLIQTYYSQSQSSRELTFNVSSQGLLHYCKLSDNRQLDKALSNLNTHNVIKNKVLKISKVITITLSDKIIPEFNDKMLFVQMEYYIFNRNVLDKVGHKGVRILYQIMSYINYKTNKDHCYASVERMSKDIGISDKTYRTYLNKLEKAKFIRVKRHEPTTEYFIDKNGVEGLLFDRWNNHYYIRHDKIKQFAEKSNLLLV